MEIKLIDKNENGLKGIIESLGICRNKQCTEKTLDFCMTDKPVPHLAALEQIWFKFHVKGLSVKARIQLLRSRLFGNMERSTRSIDMSKAKCIVPDTVKDKKMFNDFYDCIMNMYDFAVFEGESLEDAAYLLPLGIETEFDISGNGRVFFEYFTKRLCEKTVQAEHYEFALEVYRILLDDGHWYFKYAHPCQYCGKCRS